MKSATRSVLPLTSLLTLSAAAGLWLAASRSDPTDHTGASVVPSPAPSGVVERGTPVIPAPRWDGSISLSTLPLTEGARSRALGAGWMPVNRIRDLAELREGDLVSFPMEADANWVARVEWVESADGRVSVSGRLAQGAKGSFHLFKEGLSLLEGQVLNHDQKRAYQVKQQGDRVLVAKLELGEIICDGMPLEPNPVPLNPSALSRNTPVVPALDSKPSAVGVLYLDFDGETVTDPNWNGGRTIDAQPAVMGGNPISSTQITDVWRRVAEDFMPFNVTVTTIRSRYDNAPVGNRMRCIQTPTKDAAPTAGGVAYFKSYRAKFHSSGFRDNIPCWSFNSGNAAVMAMTISHELGHTLNLRHDGTPTDTYYGGHGTGNLRWGPIMGAPFSARIVQWSKGEYPDANNQEDDLNITKGVLEEANGAGTGFSADEAGGTVGTAAQLGIFSTISKTGIIHNSADRDYYQFRTAGGPISVTAVLANEPNLDPRLRIVNGSNTTIASSPVPATALGATLTATLTSGTYYLVVESGSRPAVAGNPGFTTYGSIGAYELTGTYVPLPQIPLFVEHPTPLTLVRERNAFALSISVLSNTSVKYRWKRNGTTIPGKTAPTLSIPSASAGDLGTYVAEAENTAGIATSEPAQVVVEYKPIFTQQPPSATQTVPTEGSFTTTVAADGSGAVSYQWLRDGVALDGNPSAATASLSLSDLDWYDSGNYTCIATNFVGSTTSTVLKLVVTSKPLFTSTPASTVAVAKNSTFTLRTSLVGSPTIRYQWYKGASPVPKATGPTLTLTRASESVHEGAPYFLRATNNEGSTDSSMVTVDVQDPPVVSVTSPTVVKSFAGATVTLSVAATGTETLQYQWYHNNVLLLGQVQPALTLTPLHWTQRGTYKCVATNAVGKGTSKNISLSLTSPAVIIVPPSSMKIATRGTGTLKVVAGGTPALGYQWLKNGSPIRGATKASLTLSKASDLTEGEYQVEVINRESMMIPVRSAVATVEVENAPAIAEHPLSTLAPIGGSVTLTVAATAESAPTLRYQWFKGKLLLAGETASSLVLSNLSAASSGTYHAIVTNDVGKATSRKATLTVLAPPKITSQPESRSHFEHDTVIFSVKATGAPTLSYSWHRDNGPAIAGATGPTYTIKNVMSEAAGIYHCRVTNRVGSVQSDSVTLDVAPVPEPTFTGFAPGIAAVGHRVRVNGTHLNWTTAVRLGVDSCSFVKVSPEEIVLTVPPGGRTGAVTVTTLGGSFTTPTNLTITSGNTNDLFVNARILVGSSATASGDNTDATFQAGEPAYWKGKTVWYRWRCPASGAYSINGSKMSFNYYIQVYSGSALNNLVERVSIYDYYTLQAVNQKSGPRQWDAIVNEEYFIRVDGVAYELLSPFTGAISFAIAPAASIPQAYATEPTEAVTASAATATAFPLPLSTSIGSQGVFKAVFDADHTESAFQWQVRTAEGQSLLALVFDPTTSTIAIVDAEGKAGDTHQLYSGSGRYDLEVMLDASEGRWSLLLNGQSLTQDSAALSGFDDSLMHADHIVLTTLHSGETKLPQVSSAEWLGTHSTENSP
jgi:hypothetical protein